MVGKISWLTVHKVPGLVMISQKDHNKTFNGESDDEDGDDKNDD